MTILLRALRVLAGAIVTLLLVSVLVFALTEAAPGDAANIIAGRGATAEELAEVRARFGLDDPAPQRYGRWLAGAVQGDLGTSLYSSRSVWSTIANSVGPTFSLVVVSMVIAVLVALPLAVIAAVRPNSLPDRAITTWTAITAAVPEFVIGLLLVSVFAVRLSILPSIRYVPASVSVVEWLRHLLLPCLALAAAPAAELARQGRAALREALEQDYIRAARAKGLRATSVVGKHALKNSAVPIVTVMGIWFGRLFGGAVIIELIFAIPGFGSVALDSVVRRDIPLIQGVMLFSAVVVIVVNLLVDISYAYFNPRERR